MILDDSLLSQPSVSALGCDVIHLSKNWINTFCTSPLFNFLTPSFSALQSFTLCLPLAPISISLSLIFLLSFFFFFSLPPSFSISPSLPLPSKGSNCNRNSNNTALLCTNWFSLSTHTLYCCQFTNVFFFFFTNAANVLYFILAEQSLVFTSASDAQ